MTSIGYLVFLAKGVFELQVIQPVKIFFSLHFFIAPTTYGVVPDAAIPMTESLLFISYLFKSSQPKS